MNLSLKRTEFSADGIFGILSDKDGQIAVTLEHAFDANAGNGSYLPAVPTGTYTCIRGQHQLDHMAVPFTTFEVTGVPGHTGILFHRGNYNTDSKGCILLGLAIDVHSGGEQMITQSAITFTKFMELLNGINQFTLTIT